MFSDPGGEDMLRRAVVISLFTWRRAQDSDPVDDDELYGYWGDSFPTVPGDRIGSRLWLLRRRTITESVLRDAERYSREALAWLIEDVVALRVDVQALRVGDSRCDLRVALELPDGPWELKFNDVMGMINAV